MAEIEGNSKEVGEKKVDAKEVNDENENNNNTKGIKKLRHKSTKKERRSLSFARFGCLRVESDENGGVDMEVRFPEKLNDPSHLVIMVNGLIGSAQDWRFAAKHFLKKYPGDVIVHYGKDGKPPLLLQMASDCEDLKFISALLSFKRRVVYANASFDHIVGWSTSSLRRRDELPKYQIKHLPRGDKYPHVVNVETGKTPTLDVVPYEAQINGTEKIDMEEEMIRALTKMSWERVDVYFKGSRQRLLAHLAIQASLLFTNALFFLDVPTCLLPHVNHPMAFGCNGIRGSEEILAGGWNLEAVTKSASFQSQGRRGCKDLCCPNSLLLLNPAHTLFLVLAFYVAAILLLQIYNGLNRNAGVTLIINNGEGRSSGEIYKQKQLGFAKQIKEWLCVNHSQKRA
ncbi:hypothetical protein GOBAR_AA21505 [Gossypium barbadense]|uniref:DUF676 domain-containing protein n=1 Tax=Gossypium barbadense TaxID=3634 RepID=A0A2P5X754_GOSBA|nr:hypothetical protein GOBAR_AA21505 [Gossypium barbadense]